MLKNNPQGLDTHPSVKRSSTMQAKQDVTQPRHGIVDAENSQPAIALHTLIAMLLAVIGGTFVAIVLLPIWVPSLSASFQGSTPKAYWLLARASAFVAFGLLWLTVVLGLLMTNRMARLWPGGPVAFDLHQHTSLLGLAFAMFHALILLGDHYINYTLAQIVVPFASINYRQGWVGLGQVAFYGLAIVGLSFYIRRVIGHRVWRLIHFLSFIVFLLVLVHGMTSGTDADTSLAHYLYWFSGGSVLFLSLYRILTARRPSQHRAATSR